MSDYQPPMQDSCTEIVDRMTELLERHEHLKTPREVKLEWMLETVLKEWKKEKVKNKALYKVAQALISSP